MKDLPLRLKGVDQAASPASSQQESIKRGSSPVTTKAGNNVHSLDQPRQAQIDNQELSYSMQRWLQETPKNQQHTQECNNEVRQQSSQAMSWKAVEMFARDGAQSEQNSELRGIGGWTTQSQ